MMSNLDNIIAKISEEGKTQADEILRQANEKKDILIKERISEANIKRDAILERTEREKESLEQRKISSAKLQARDIILKAKQEVIERVLEEAKEQLKVIDDTKYEKFVLKKLQQMHLQKEDELLLQKGRNRDAFSDYTVSDRTVDSGFAIKRGDVLFNNDFSSIIDSEKDELEVEIVKKLF